MLKNLTGIFKLFESDKVQKRLLYFAVLFCFISIFILNHAVPMLLDDLVYSLVKFDEKVEFPNIFVQIKDFHIFHYFSWGGRTVAHLIANILLLLPPVVQDILNTSAFVFLIVLIYRMSNVNNRHNFLIVLFVFLMIFTFIPRFVSDVLWIVGSSNYMWTTMLIFLTIYFYYQYSMGKRYKDSLPRIFGILVLSIAAGWTNENMGPTLVLMILAYCIYFKWKGGTIPKWALSGFVGSLIGSLLLILSPGNAKRAAVEGFEKLDLLQVLSDNLANIGQIFMYYRIYIFPLLGIFILCLVLYIFTTKQNGKTEILFNAFVFLIAGHVALLATYAAPSFPLRAYFGLLALTISSIVILYANISFDKIYFKIPNLLFIAAMFSLFVIESYKIFNAFTLVTEVNEYRVEQVREAKRHGLDTVKVAKPVMIDYKYEYVEAEQFWEIYYKMDRVMFSNEEYIRKNDK